MNIKSWSRAGVLAAACVTAATPAFAQDTVKIGVIAEFSGPFADYGAADPTAA